MVPLGPPRRPDGDTAARTVLATVCAVVLVVPIFVGDHDDAPALPPSRVATTVAAQDRSGADPQPAATTRHAGPPRPSAAARREAARLPPVQQAAQVLLVGFD